MFLFNWVIFMFKIFIFRGVSFPRSTPQLFTEASAVSVVSTCGFGGVDSSMRFKPRPVKGLTSASEVKGYGRSKGKICGSRHGCLLYNSEVVFLLFLYITYCTITVYYFWKHYNTSQTNKLKDMIYITLVWSVVSWVISYPLRGLIDLSRYYRNCRNRLNRFGYRRSPHYSLPKGYSRHNKILIMQAIKGQGWLTTIDETLSSSGGGTTVARLPCNGFSHVSPIVLNKIILDEQEMQQGFHIPNQGGFQHTNLTSESSFSSVLSFCTVVG